MESAMAHSSAAFLGALERPLRGVERVRVYCRTNEAAVPIESGAAPSGVERNVAPRGRAARRVANTEAASGAGGRELGAPQQQAGGDPTVPAIPGDVPPGAIRG